MLIAVGGWRGIFWFNLLFGIASFLAAAARFVPEARSAGTPARPGPGLTHSKWGRALREFTFAVIEGESAGYRTWWVVLLFAVAALRRRRVRRDRAPQPRPRAAARVLPHTDLPGATVVGFRMSFGLFAVFFFTALYLQIVANFSGWRIALEFTAMAVAYGGRRPRLRQMDAGARRAGADEPWLV